MLEDYFPLLWEAVYLLNIRDVLPSILHSMKINNAIKLENLLMIAGYSVGLAI